MLPHFVQNELFNSYYPHRHHHYSDNNKEELLSISNQKDTPKRLEAILKGIVHRSSWQQTLKNGFTAGFKSFAYIWPKLRKGILKR